MSDKMRKEFEDWYWNEYHREDYDKYRGAIFGKVAEGVFAGEYHNGRIDAAWRAWQASRTALCVNACAGMADPAAEIAELKRQRDELLGALHDAATSLETIQLRSFGADSCLDDKHSMRSYAGARAAVAREAMDKAKGSAS